MEVILRVEKKTQLIVHNHVETKGISTEIPQKLKPKLCARSYGLYKKG